MVYVLSIRQTAGKPREDAIEDEIFLRNSISDGAPGAQENILFARDRPRDRKAVPLAILPSKEWVRYSLGLLKRLDFVVDLDSVQGGAASRSRPPFRVGFGRQIAFGGSEAGTVCHTRFWQHPGALHPPFTFYMRFCMSGRNPGRNPRKTRSCGLRRHGQPAPIAHPRCRRAPGIPGGEPARWGGHPRRLSP